MSELQFFEINGQKYSIAFVEEFNLYRICEYRKDLGHYLFYDGVKANSVEEAINRFITMKKKLREEYEIN